MSQSRIPHSIFSKPLWGPKMSFWVTLLLFVFPWLPTFLILALVLLLLLCVYPDIRRRRNRANYGDNSDYYIPEL
ncbi:hypothetical protein N7539_008926 [Penicillium diatomitis]|uniref:Uncharacterized protein n=1 Tax=Penicillium diatomitis TaxID=2819901 RepID=A0A9W9WLE6_9EURO|nr:uncharacterized protein N7539_008926 [Penicillium diatomitis]KAJ5469308.1 hypothetical protein N7539_008926 [Penicillium diatomitis]